MNKNKGIVLKLDNSEESGTAEIVRAFGSYNRSSGQPYLVVNYNTTGDLPFADNTFYYNNWYAGKYLGYDSSLSLLSGRLSALNKKIKWEIRKVDGGYIIRSDADTTKYLAAPVTTTATTVEMVTVADMSIPDRCKWTITKLNDGYCLIQNVYSGKYLYAGTSRVSQSAILGTEGTLTYRQRVWRYAGEGYYGTGSEYTKTELNSNFAIDTCTIFAGESIVPTVRIKPNNALWADVTDFDYSGYDTTKLTYDTLTGTFTSISTSTSLYSTQVTATHKGTGLSKTFSFVVNPKAVLHGVYATGHDHGTWLEEAGEIVEDAGYSEATKYLGGYTVDTINEFFDNDENGMFISRSHGVKFLDGETLVYNGIEIDEADDIDYSYLELPATIDFTNLKLVALVGCYTFMPDLDTDISRTIFEKGVENVVGFCDSVDCDSANEWVVDFLNKLKEGKTPTQACVEICESNDYYGTGLEHCVIISRTE